MSLRIVATADSHFDEHSPRWQECLRVHGWVADFVRREQPDVVLHGGDVFERASTPVERLAVADFFQSVADVAPVVVIRGNHERGPTELDIFARLETRHPIHVVETVGVVSLTLAGERLAVGCLAWPSYGSALEVGGAQEALRSVLRGLGDEMDAHDGAARLLLAHASIDGSLTSSGQPLVGAGINLGLSDLALVRAQATVMGHIHLPQAFDALGAPAFYCGSPFRHDYGENEDKSIVTIDVDARHCEWRRVGTPARPMLRIEATWADGVLAFDEPGPVAGADVRLRYHVPAEHRDMARAAAVRIRQSWLDAGAASIKLDEEIAVVTRARAPEVAAAGTLAGKIEAHWRSTGDVPPPDAAERLLGPRLSKVEEAA